MANAQLGDTLRIRVVFHDWSSNDDEGGEIVDPATVEGFIKDEDLEILSTFTPVHEALGTYYYDWTPNAEGDFHVEFKGTFDDNSVDIVRELFTVTALGTGPGSTATLGEDQWLFWAADISPMLIDPDEVLAVYPDASPLEAAEFIRLYSQEILTIFGSDEPPFLALEYIRAATLCALSKLHDLSGGGAISSIQLGDFQITNSPMTSRNGGSQGAAVTWCELAAALKEDMITGSGRVGMKAILKGDAFLNPIPPRGLRSFD